ncbi:MAG: hypothetical protein DMG05_22830 [Acidobacteria bacterium]|nr:MAG: hypothetical protein DMG05_22830 [Acidobacteriota bacterium]
MVYATAPFLHLANELGLYVVVRLKANLPQLLTQAQARFESMAPTRTFWFGQDQVEVWDADDFDPWETLDWITVHKPLLHIAGNRPVPAHIHYQCSARHFRTSTRTSILDARNRHDGGPPLFFENLLSGEPQVFLDHVQF